MLKKTPFVICKDFGMDGYELTVLSYMKSPNLSFAAHPILHFEKKYLAH